MASEYFIQRYVQSRRMEGSTATVSGMEYGDMHVLYLLCDYVLLVKAKVPVWLYILHFICCNLWAMFVAFACYVIATD